MVMAMVLAVTRRIATRTAPVMECSMVLKSPNIFIMFRLKVFSLMERVSGDALAKLRSMRSQSFGMSRAFFTRTTKEPTRPFIQGTASWSCLRSKTRACSSDWRLPLKMARTFSLTVMLKMGLVKGTTSPTFHPYLSARDWPTMQPLPSMRKSRTCSKGKESRPASSRYTFR